ncbi:hypothetical protein AMK59_2287 [Oryctes borbonicus]|uniref:Lipocalin/cytosolic fatty-acid binding domain-containing protein n=1 Tax=Oryctes borbonicus TaxID=1629725 RepID=A0A0T6BB62_9SCAR|nr:hypothetical protein AMK59_2287 [Oryctes borbonicus]
MLGVWYVIRKTSTSSACITYNFTSTEEPDKYEIEQISHTIIPGKHAYHYTGELTVPNSAVPASMTVKFPLNFGSASYTVFITDYENYAGIFTCQKLAVSNRQSVSILSRKKDLPMVYFEKIQNRLKQFNINPYDLSIISQKNCAEETDGRDVSIDSDTFSIKSIAGVVRKVGDKVGDGIEYIAGGAKKLYKDHVADSKEDIQKPKFTASNLHPDAEWIP